MDLQQSAISAHQMVTFIAFLIAVITQISYVVVGMQLSSTGSPNPDNTRTMRVGNLTSTVDLPVTAMVSMPFQHNGTDDTDTGKSRNFGLGSMIPNTETLLRAFYVVVGVTAIIVIYFVVRALRLRCRKNRKLRYGLLTTNDDSIEMRHLEEDDEEDATVFDRMQSNSRR